MGISGDSPPLFELPSSLSKLLTLTGCGDLRTATDANSEVLEIAAAGGGIGTEMTVCVVFLLDFFDENIL